MGLLQNTVTGLSKFIEDYATTQKIDRTSDLTQHWIGYKGDHPFVYLLTSNVFKEEKSEYAEHCETMG